MTFPRYPKYKASGFTWLGDVPEHWQLKRLGHYFDERRERASDTEFEPLSVTKLGIVPRLESAAKTQDGDNRKKVLAGDFVINSRSDRKGSSGLSPLDGSVSLICTVLIPTGLHGPFVHHLFRSELFQEEYYRWGKGIVADLWSTNFSDMKNIVLGVPSEAEQTQIARFLDHETARIDALIEEQQRLIELLKEKRQAVISHAVTKGLDPTVPMKDSGVEWLGEVPAHWELTRVGWQCIVGNGCTPARDNLDYWEDGHYPWLNSSKVNLDRVVDADQFVTSKALKECALPIVKPGCVLMAITGEGKTRGMVTITEIEATINQHVAFIEPRGGRLLATYLHDWLSANYSRIRHDSADWGSTKAAITCADIRAYPLPLPPEKEQEAICQFVGSRSALFDGLMSAAEENVALLQERRSALISAAVTGKIDVRGWQPSASTQAPQLEVAEAH